MSFITGLNDFKGLPAPKPAMPQAGAPGRAGQPGIDGRSGKPGISG